MLGLGIPDELQCIRTVAPTGTVLDEPILNSITLILAVVLDIRGVVRSIFGGTI